MKEHVVIPVAYEIDEVCGYYQLRETKHHDTKMFGVAELEKYLNAGWKILSVQTASLPACCNEYNNGVAIFQYILESP